MVKFTLQNSAWLTFISGLLKVERISKSYDQVEICKLKMIRMKKAYDPRNEVGFT